MKTKRETCFVCDSKIKLDSRGLFNIHGHVGKGDCPGTGKRPKSAPELLRIFVSNMDVTTEAFNERFTLPQLIKIYTMFFVSEWDVYPDEWSRRQVAEALEGIPPRWSDRAKPVYAGRV